MRGSIIVAVVVALAAVVAMRLVDEQRGSARSGPDGCFNPPLLRQREFSAAGLSVRLDIARPSWHPGEVSEWLKEHAWKACVRVSVPRVRIPPSPFLLRDTPQAPRTPGLARVSRLLTGLPPSNRPQTENPSAREKRPDGKKARLRSGLTQPAEVGKAMEIGVCARPGRAEGRGVLGALHDRKRPDGIGVSRP